MTREEAKGNLNMIRVAFIDTVTVEQGKIIDDTFRAAIKALEQEPCEDAISRQAVLDLAKKGVLISNDSYKSVCRAINDLPSVNPQPKTGHWIRQDNTKEPLYSWYFCSECNSVIGDKTKFCSNCGAKMEDKE